MPLDSFWSQSFSSQSLTPRRVNLIFAHPFSSWATGSWKTKTLTGLGEICGRKHCAWEREEDHPNQLASHLGHLFVFLNKKKRRGSHLKTVPGLPLVSHPPEWCSPALPSIYLLQDLVYNFFGAPMAHYWGRQCTFTVPSPRLAPFGAWLYVGFFCIGSSQTLSSHFVPSRSFSVFLIASFYSLSLCPSRGAERGH